MNEAKPDRLEPVLMRLPSTLRAELRELAERTRVPQASYLREAVADLLRKYRQPNVGGAP